jgi:hypothetical protein
MTGHPDGAYTFTVRARDAAGNTGAAATNTYDLDRSDPAVAIAARPGDVANNSTPVWSFTNEAGVTTECRLTRDSTVVSAYTACADVGVYDLTLESDGIYTFTVLATDSAGNASAVSSSYRLDRQNPAITIDGPGVQGSDRNPVWRFELEEGARTECQLMRGESVISAFAGCTSPAAYDLSGEPDGVYTFEIRATDQAGNMAAASDQYVLAAAAASATTDETTPPAPTGGDTKPVKKAAGAEAPTVRAHAKAKHATSVLHEFIKSAKTVSIAVAKGSAFPISLGVVVLLFLVIQAWIDRRDPKLALAPVHPDRHLDFKSPEGDEP